MTSFLIGAVAGAAATVPMTVVMETLHERLPGEPPRPLPPREITDNVVARAGAHDDLDERDKQQLTLAGHFGYGALCGAVFGVMSPRSPAAAVTSGAVFGVAVWGVSYLGLLPGLGIRHHAKHDPPARTALMIAAHLVYGAATGAFTAAMRGERDKSHEATKDTKFHEGARPERPA